MKIKKEKKKKSAKRITVFSVNCDARVEMNEIDINKSDIFLNSLYVKTNLFKDFFPNIFWDPFCCLHMESDFCFCVDCGLKMVDHLINMHYVMH